MKAITDKAAGTDTRDARGPGRPRDEDAHRRILQAALQLLEEQGFSGTTVDAIAERANASKATIYRWWPNKGALLMASFREAVSAELPFPDTGSLEGDLRAQMRQFAALLMTRKGRMLAALLAAAQEDQEVAAAFREHWIAARRVEGRAVLERHRRSGEMRNFDLDLVIDLLYAPLYYRLLTGYRPLSLEYADRLADAILEGLQRR